MNKIISTHEYLNTDKIPWECRRNKSTISKFTNVYWAKNKFILSENTFIPKDLNNFFINKKDIRIKDNTININKGYFHFALFFSNIGHYFTDDVIPIAKMILLNNDQNNKDINIIFLKNSEEQEKYQILSNKNKQFLKPFTNKDIKFLSEYNQEIFFNEIIIFHKNYVRKIKNWNEPNNQNYKYLTNFVNIYKDYFNCNQSIKPNKIIILSRKNASYRKLVNENELLIRLKNIYDDVKLIEFEKMSIKDQIMLMNETKIFISPHGAGVISGFFMQPNTKCIIIHPYGFPTYCDYPTIYRTYLESLNINCIQWTNNIDKNKDKNFDLYKYRDSNIHLNINDFLKII